MPPRIHVFGASGSGTSTLGAALAERLGVVHHDTDRIYWAPTDPPFEEKRPLEERQALLHATLAADPGWVLSGSLCGWGDGAIAMFDLAVYLRIPPDLRMARLRAREAGRYGAEAVGQGGWAYERSQVFYAWAAQYDAGPPTLRSAARHEAWMAALPCPLLRLEGDLSVAERVASVLAHPAIATAEAGRRPALTSLPNS